MTGPEHYREAERLLDQARRLAEQSRSLVGSNVPVSEAVVVFHAAIQEANVHATLALAAATAAAQATAYDGDETSARSRGWAGVA